MAFKLGSFAGGAAKGFGASQDRRAQSEQAEREFSLKERQLSNQEKLAEQRSEELKAKSAQTKFDKRINLIKQAFQNGNVSEAFNKMTVDAANDGGVPNAQATLDATIRATETTEDAGKRESKQLGANARSQQQAKQDVGPVTPASEPPLSAVGKMQAERAALNNRLDSATPKEAEIINNQVAELTVRIRSSNSFDPRAASQAAETAATTLSKGEVRAARKSLDSSNIAIDELNKTISAFKENPESAGISGEVIQFAGGIVQQIPVIGQALLDAVGVAPEQVTAVRTNAITLVANLLSAMTGEQSGRFTEPERALTKEALGVLRASSSVEQTVAALNTVATAQETAQIRAATKLLIPFGGVRGLLDANGKMDEAKLDQALQSFASTGLGGDAADELMLKILKTNKIEF